MQFWDDTYVYVTVDIASRCTVVIVYISTVRCTPAYIFMLGYR